MKNHIEKNTRDTHHHLTVFTGDSSGIAYKCLYRWESDLLGKLRTLFRSIGSETLQFKRERERREARQTAQNRVHQTAESKDQIF